MTADPFKNIPNADDSLNGEFSPARVKPPASWLPSPADQYAIAEVAAKAGRYLAAAYRAGLPEPRYVTISAGEIDGQPYSGIGFQFTTASKVYAWAGHFGAEVGISDSGTSASLPGLQWHEVQVYSGDKSKIGAEKPVPPQPPMTDTMSGSYVPGLAEHTQAAEIKYGDKVTGPRGSGTVVSTAQFNNASTVMYDEPQAFVIEQNASLKLAEHTAAAQQKIIEASR